MASHRRYAFIQRFGSAFKSAVRLSFVAIALGASGLSAAEPNVGGTGTATVERLPDRMRVTIDLTGKGESLAAALAKLKERRATAESALALLGAEKESIRFGEPQVTRGEEQQQMNRMIMERMGRSRRAATATPDAEAKPEPTSAAVQVTADWVLQAGTIEELLIATDALQKKIKDADLGGTKEKPKLTAEEEELQAEMQQSNPYSSSSSQAQKPGEPSFLFVALIGDDERAKLSGEAFAKAKKDAERLAAAAGMTIGKLVAIHGQGKADYDRESGYMRSNPMYYELRQMQMAAMQSAVVDSQNGDKADAFAMQPGKVKYSVNITAQFELAK